MDRQPGKRSRKLSIAFMIGALSALGVHNAAHATNGAYVVGNGPLSSAVGGTTLAMPQDSLVAADNPAGMASVGKRVDAYMFLLTARIDSTFCSPINHFFSSINSPAPGLGFNLPLDSRWTVGMSVTGAGLAIRYNAPVLAIPGLGKANDSLTEVNMAPTVTYKLTQNLAVGASIVLGLQQFRADGLLGADAAGNPVPLHSHGNSYAAGVGGAVGALWTPVPMVSIGVSYFSKMRFSTLSGYDQDLFASTGGSLDMPSRYGIGVAFHPMAALTVGIDYDRINWSDVAALGNPATFNWHSQNVVRVGAIYDLNDRFTLRAGFSHANAYVDAYHTLANFYAPGIDTNAITAGFSYAVTPYDKLSFSAEYDIPRTIVGAGASAGTNIHNQYQLYTIGYSHLFR